MTNSWNPHSGFLHNSLHFIYKAVKILLLLTSQYVCTCNLGRE